jgi:hypothetical protein
MAPGSALPSGLVLLPGANGVSTYIGGVPTAPSADDDEGEPVSLVVTDGTQTLTFTINLGVSPLAFSPDTLPPGRVGVPYMATFTPAGAPPYQFFAEPRFALPPGLTLSADGVLQGTPTTAGNFPMAIILMNEDTGMGRLFRFAVDNAAGEAPAVSVSPTPIQIFHTTGSPDPAPTPIAINATSGSFTYGLSISGIPGASLSSSAGTAPAVSNLNWNLAGVGVGTYNGILGVRAQSTNLFDYVPVTLIVADPPPCSYSVNPVSSSIGAAGGSGSFGVVAGAGCAWTAVSQAPWLTLTGATGGSGSGPIDFAAAANPDAGPRAGTIDVQGQIYSVTQFGSTCSFAISPVSLPAPAAGGSAVVTITASGATCDWTASGLSATPAIGTGSGSVTVTIPPNVSATSVELNATIAGQTFTVMQAGASCSVALSPIEASSPSGGGTGSVQVSPTPGCSYDTVNGPAWVSVTSGGSGSGPGTLVYEVQPNSTTAQRSGTLLIGGHAFQITQEGVPCSVTIDTSALGSPYGTGPGLVGAIGVTTNGPNCPWVAGSGAGWASLSPTSGSTSATIHVSVQSNIGSPTQRSTDLTVAGQTIAITQAGVDCTYSLQSSTGSAPGQGGNGSVGVVAPGACAWTAATNDPTWLSILSSGSGGTANVLFSVAPNLTASPRVGTLTIAFNTYTVTQAAAACSYTLTPGSATAAPGGESSSFSFVSTSAGCTPSVVSYAGWVSASSDGAGTVNYTVQANPTAAARSATIQVGDKTFSITQFGATCGFSFNSYGSLFAQPGGAGTILGSTTGCTGNPGSDQSFVVVPGAPVGPSPFTLPFTVLPYGSLNPNVRYAKIVIGGQIHIVKQTSW